MAARGCRSRAADRSARSAAARAVAPLRRRRLSRAVADVGYLQRERDLRFRPPAPDFSAAAPRRRRPRRRSGGAEPGGGCPDAHAATLPAAAPASSGRPRIVRRLRADPDPLAIACQLGHDRAAMKQPAHALAASPSRRSAPSRSCRPSAIPRRRSAAAAQERWRCSSPPASAPRGRRRPRAARGTGRRGPGAVPRSSCPASEWQGAAVHRRARVARRARRWAAPRRSPIRGSSGRLPGAPSPAPALAATRSCSACCRRDLRPAGERLLRCPRNLLLVVR